MRRIVAVAVVFLPGLFLLCFIPPLVMRWRATADRARCVNNLRQLATVGLGDYAQKHTEFPAGTVVNPDLPPEKRLSWVVPLLPRLGRPDLGNAIAQGAAWDAPANRGPADTFLAGMVCPTIFAEHPTDNPAPLHYPGIAGVGPDAAKLPPDAPHAGVFRYDAPTPLDALRDGVSNCLLLLETSADTGRWIAGGPASVRPLDPTMRPYVGPGRPFGGHPAGANAAFADGSVRFFANSVSPNVLELLTGIDDGSP